jgi:hypothetical protein
VVVGKRKWGTIGLRRTSSSLFSSSTSWNIRFSLYSKVLS